MAGQTPCHKPGNPAVCPLCNKPNHCRAGQETPCWCASQAFPAQLIDAAQAISAKQCICQDCLHLHLNQHT